MGAEAILAHWLLEQPQFLDDPLVELWEIVQCFVNEKKNEREKVSRHPQQDSWEGESIKCLYCEHDFDWLQ